MNIYEERMDSEEELSGAINTYRFVVLGHDYEDIINDNRDMAAFFIDVSDYHNNDPEDVAQAIVFCLKVFEDHEHYEKCADIMDFIKEVENEI